MRILIAEDDRALREVLQRGLREAGYVVDAVHDGDAAELALKRDDYELAVLDWRMPGRSGVEVIDRVRKAGILIPILLLTARDAPPDRVTGLNSGADDYLIKPFDFPELLARLQALQRRPALLFAPRRHLWRPPLSSEHERDSIERRAHRPHLHRESPHRTLDAPEPVDCVA